MDWITRKQISELPEKEMRQHQAVFNHRLGIEYAAQQRAKKVMKAKSEIEFNNESEVQDVPECE